MQTEDAEYRIELLKERIYATIALLAVMLAIHPEHTTPIHAALILAGTAFSLWVASIIASRMARRIILGHAHETEEEQRYRLSKQAPLLTAAIFPVTMFLVSAAHIIPFEIALILGIAGLFTFMISVSYLSAQAFKISLLHTLYITAVQLFLAAGLIWLKLHVGE